MPVVDSVPAPPSPPLLDHRDDVTPSQKKKKKKKPKKTIKPKDPVITSLDNDPKQPILCISRNKHWKYISSYHGPWLQLPLELLESLLILNVDPTTLSTTEPRIPTFPKRDTSPPRSLRLATARPPPPPIDPGVFKSVTTIRRLIDEASDLAVRAASGLSAVALGSIRSSPTGTPSPWATAQSLGINPLENQPGRAVNMSAMRTHRLRTLAVQRLAAAYKADEIAASVMVMQGASALDDIAERVLKTEPTNPDAQYVHFFHEKIPSRQLAESTTTKVLDDLVAAYPQRLEYFRTRGIVRCFRDEYMLAIRDFTHALKESRAARKAKHTHNPELDHRPKTNKNRKKNAGKSNGQAPPNGTSPCADDSDPLDPLEPQLLFLRGAAYLQYVIFLIEEAVLNLEGVSKTPPGDGAELRLCYLEGSKYGGIEIGNQDGPLGPKEGKKLQAYREVLATPEFRETVSTFLKKSMRDHEKFLSHFDTLDGPPPPFEGDLAQRTEYAFLLSEALRPGNHSHIPPLPDMPPIFTTYHPLLIESHFSILICNLLLGDFVTLLPAFAQAAALVDGLEGYPVFLPARSMAQAEFIEVLERLAAGWKAGSRPHSLSQRRLTIEPPTESLSSASSSTTAADTPHAVVDLAQALDCARILLAPVIGRQRERAEKAAAEKAAGIEKKKSLSINIPLHGPRVEIILAWLGAVHLPDMEGIPI